MSTDRDVTTRIVRSWLHEDAHEDADRILNLVLDEIDTTPQRSASWLARRFPLMKSNIARLGIAAVVIVLAVIVGMNFLPGPNIGGSPEATPSPSPSPSATAEPTPSPAIAPPLTQTFTSQMHGISVSYPEGWTAQAATEPWTGTDDPHFFDPFADLLIDPLTENLFLLLGSQPIGSSTPDEWVAERMAASGCPATTEPIAVDGATGMIGANNCATIVAVTTAGRGYWIRLYTPTSNEGFAFAPYDRAWFEEVLATVQLLPEDAVDTLPQSSP